MATPPREDRGWIDNIRFGIAGSYNRQTNLRRPRSRLIRQFQDHPIIIMQGGGMIFAENFLTVSSSDPRLIG
jgi:hypothetical protein